MPYVQLKGANLYYEDEGHGEETIVFSHSLLFSLRMFDGLVNHLKDKYRCVSFDFRGQGKSEITRNGYDMDTLTGDAAELIQKLKCSPCHFLGFSMGGFVGMRLAIRHAELLKSLILVSTSSEPEALFSRLKFNLLALVGQSLGLQVVLNQVMPTMFGQSFLKDPHRKELKQAWENYFLANDRKGVAKAVKGVANREGVTNSLFSICLPTLIIAGEKDIATTPEKSGIMHDAIKGSLLKIIPRSGHMSPVEEPHIVNENLDSFLGGIK